MDEQLTYIEINIFYVYNHYSNLEEGIMKRLVNNAKGLVFEKKRVYLKDLSKIIKIFEDKKYSVGLEDEEYEYESIEEIIANCGNFPKCLKISGKYKSQSGYERVSINFSGYRIYVYANSESDKNQSFMYEMTKLIEALKPIEEKDENNKQSLILYEKDKPVTEVIELRGGIKIDETESKGVSFWKRKIVINILLILLGSIMAFLFQVIYRLIFNGNPQ